MASAGVVAPAGMPAPKLERGGKSGLRGGTTVEPAGPMVKVPGTTCTS